MNEKASKNANAKLTTEQVLSIRELYGPQMGSIRLSKKFNLSRSCIMNVVKHLSYKDIGGPVKEINKKHSKHD